MVLTGRETIRDVILFPALKHLVPDARAEDRRHPLAGKWLIAASLLVCVALAVFITKTSAKVYAASAVIQVNSASTQTTGDFQSQQASQALAKTYATQVTDRNFLAKIQARVANGRYSVGDLKQKVGARRSRTRRS